MNGHEHYREAEARIEAAFESVTCEMAAVQMAAAQVHATLALVAATIEPARDWTALS